VESPHADHLTPHASRLTRQAARLGRRPFLLGLLLTACAVPSPAVAPTPTRAPEPAAAPARPSPPAPGPTPRPTPTAPPGARPGGRAVEGVLTLPTSLNPLLADDAPARRLAALLYSGLVGVAGDTLDAVPALAERWEASPDGRRYTFQVRAGLTWHDGKPLTAGDVVATFRALAAERGLSVRAATLAGLMESVVARDDLSLTISLKQPYAPFLVELATLPILPAAQLETGGGSLDASAAAAAPIGAGPFALASRGGDRVTLRRFAGYFGGAAILDEIELRRLSDSEALITSLAGGAIDLVELDLAWLTQPQLDRLRGSAGVSLAPYETLALALLFFQLSAGRGAPVADPRVRRALAHALDRPALASAATFGFGRVPVGTLPPISWAAVPGIEPAYPADPARAASLLDSAGWPLGADGLRRRDGQPLTVALDINAGNRLRSALQHGVATAWQALGVTVAPREEPFGAFVERVVQRGDFDAAILGFDLGPDPDQTLLWSSSAGRAGYNVGHYSNAQVDRLLAAGRATSDRAERARIYEEVQRAVLTDLPALPLVSPPGLLAVGARLRNLAPSPVDDSHGAARWWLAA
jgi:peptide/nickel transport system substrate-binding protein